MVTLSLFHYYKFTLSKIDELSTFQTTFKPQNLLFFVNLTHNFSNISFEPNCQLETLETQQDEQSTSTRTQEIHGQKGKQL